MERYAPSAKDLASRDVVSRAIFGDALIHVEFITPSMPEAEGQQRGNSGIYVQGRYEVQVLDSYGLDLGLGDCGSIYGVKVADVTELVDKLKNEAKVL